MNSLSGGLVHDKEGDEREEHPDKEHSPERHLHACKEWYHPQTKQCHCLDGERPEMKRKREGESERETREGVGEGNGEEVDGKKGEAYFHMQSSLCFNTHI